MGHDARDVDSRAIRYQVSACVCAYRRNATLLRVMSPRSTQGTVGLFDHSAFVVDNDAPGRDGVERSGGHARSATRRLFASSSSV